MPRPRKSRKPQVWQSSYEVNLSRGERTAFAYTPASAIAVPVLPRLEIQATSVDKDSEHKKLAIAMAKCGIMQPHHFIGNVSQAVDDAFAEFFQGIHAPTSFYLSDDIEKHNPYDSNYNTDTFSHSVRKFRERKLTDDDKYAYIPGVKDNSKRKVGGFVLYNNDYPRWIDIGKQLDVLEKHQKHLGRTILYHLTQAMDSHLGITGPDKILALCECDQWQGEGDESQAFEEYIYNSELYEKYKKRVKIPNSRNKYADQFDIKDCTPEEIKKAKAHWGGITKAQFDSCFPEWSFFHWGKTKKGILDLEKTPVRTLRNATLVNVFKMDDLLHNVIELQKHTEKYGKLLNDHCHLRLMGDNDDTPSDLRAPYICYWNRKEDVTSRILDSIHDHEANCGNSIDISYDHLFYADDQRSIDAAMRTIKPLVESLRLCETILQCVGEPL